MIGAEGCTRRRFLAVAGAAAAACACSSAGTTPAQVGVIAAGNVAQLPVGSLRAVGNAPTCIARDAGGVYSMTLTCTHTGCDMGANGSVSPEGLFCGCHGSEFDVNGNVVVGPARYPLDHFAVSVDAGGNLTIHGDEVVGATERLTV
ncbi:MAG TPA: Rieske (2Fe-2S) protein [Polyangiaceae bacterium]|nr:Rieske (2Fe-2S) protein [Polyangiaceae bacterium]